MTTKSIQAIAILIIMFSISACGISRQEAFQRDVEQVNQSCEALFSDPVLDPIRDKVALESSDKQTFAMKTNMNYPNKIEKTAIGIWTDKRDQCNALQTKLYATVMPPAILSVYQASKNNTDSLIAELYLGKITYSSFATQRAKKADEFREKVANIEQSIRQQNAQNAYQAEQLKNQRIANCNTQKQTEAMQQMHSETMTVFGGQPNIFAQNYGQTKCRNY